MNYTYTKLGDLKTGQTVNVYGVVKEIVKKPYRTQGPGKAVYNSPILKG